MLQKVSTIGKLLPIFNLILKMSSGITKIGSAAIKEGMKMVRDMIQKTAALNTKFAGSVADTLVFR